MVVPGAAANRYQLGFIQHLLLGRRANARPLFYRRHDFPEPIPSRRHVVISKDNDLFKRAFS